MGRGKKYQPEQVVNLLRQIEVAVANGKTTAQAAMERTGEHLLEEILLMAIAAVLSGAGSWNEIEGYGKAKRLWFKGFLKLPGGIPSHDRFNRVTSALDPAEMEKGFAEWVVSIARLTAGEVVAIDGKALCGTREAGKKTLVHMVSEPG